MNLWNDPSRAECKEILDPLRRHTVITVFVR